jgi:predicted unusual protein kinase regulating ubiquinone biosynthesis (AarF/ABC1/UbiB family)
MSLLTVASRPCPSRTVQRVNRRRAAVAAVAAGLTAAAGYYLAVQRAHREQAVTGVGRRARATRVARIGTRAGRRWAMHRARRTFASAGRRERLDAEFELRTAEDVAATLGDMKGALMKLGQMASYLDAGLPEPVRAALADLQQDAPPMSPELAAEVVERELGGPPDVVFETWDPQPIASASIGQVHRAMTHDGQAVAVKVQYPGVDDAIRSDLDNADVFMGALGLLFPGLDPAPIVAELRLRLLEEVDYHTEAANQRLFVDFYRDHPFIHIPAVLDELSTGRVLTTELGDGVRFEELLTWSQAERDLAGEAIYRFVFRSLYRLHAFNGDPHPGNYLFRPGGQVTFLDFGLVKRFAPEDIDKLATMVRAMAIDHDIAGFRRAVERAGFIVDTSPFTDEQVVDYMGHFYSFILEERPVTVTPEWSSESVRRFFDLSGPHGEMIRAANVPPAFVIIQRINLGLLAVLGQLRATANWRAVAEELWPWANHPPSTPLGRAEAEWWTTRRA